MFAGGKLVGLMGVGQTVGDRPQQLTNSQRRSLEMAVSLVGLSIKNAQLFRRVRQLSAVDYTCLSGPFSPRAARRYV